MGILTVVLEKCTGLKDADGIGKSDPYVTLTVKEDGWLGDDDVGQQKSSIKSGEQNPEYNETFMFTIPTLDNHKLYMSVKDEDVGKDDKLGWCEIKLEDVDGLGEDPVSIEKVVDRNLIKANGMIYIKLSYKE